MKRQAAISIILNKKNEVCLVLRRDLPVWVLPGGGIDDDETPERAAIREADEETGLKVKVIRKVGYYTPKNRLGAPTHLFLCEKTSGQLTKGAETKDCRFFHISDLPNFMPPAHSVFIEHALLPCMPDIHCSVPATTYRLLIKTLFQHPILILKYLFQKIFQKRH